jgi:transporter family-2 protein
VDRLLALAAVLVAGGLVAVQPPLNAQLARSTGSLGAAFVSLAGSALIVGVLLLASGEVGQLRAVTSVPPGYLLGGVVGAVNVTVAIVAVRTLGAGGVVAALITTQLVVSALLDRAGVLGLDRTPITPTRLAGFGLLLAGTALVASR